MKRQILNFLLLLGFFTMTAQSGSITGSVTDSNTNDPLPGVNVIVKNTTNGTNTDFNGNFSVDNVSAGDVLVFSYLGYKTYEYTVSNSFNVSISLDEDIEALEQVVVLGYVSQKAAWGPVLQPRFLRTGPQARVLQVDVCGCDGRPVRDAL